MIFFCSGVYYQFEV